jgi:cob(I)alamin adenosyltransferase
MKIREVISSLLNTELQKAFLEIKEWMATGVLKPDGVVRSIHKNCEASLNYEVDLRVIRDEILFEIGERFSEVDDIKSFSERFSEIIKDDIQQLTKQIQAVNKKIEKITANFHVCDMQKLEKNVTELERLLHTQTHLYALLGSLRDRIN